MNLFNKSDAVEIDENKWKTKYQKLLDEHELNQKNYEDEQEVLCKTIVRLSLATKGLDKQLDPHLDKIRKQLKSGVKSAGLRRALDEFSNALLTLEDARYEEKLADTTLLFEFLITLFPQQKSALKLIQDQCQNFTFKTSKDLFLALSDVIQFSPPATLAKNDALSTQTTNNYGGIDTEAIVEQLLKLLETIEIPKAFELQAKELTEQFKQSASFESLQILISDCIQLLQEVKKHQQLEHKEMAVFLSNLTEQLNELGLAATGANVAAQIAAKKRNLLDQSVSAQMVDLQKSSETATSLEPLKKLINTRLLSIAYQIQEHAKNEDFQRQENEKQLNTLTQKLAILDAESKELKNKLIIAHGMAMRDPLTGLPNRLAYEENVNIEIARWRRYHTPLTMVVWDIDFFKKINDTYGHKAGDKTLIIIANLLTEHCRETDFVARLGGEEFIMLLPNTDGGSALILANKIRNIIEKTGFNSGGSRIAITISCGLSQFHQADSGESVFERADQALYKAKAEGRNQCVLN